MKPLDSIRRIIAAYYWAAYSLHHKFFLRPGLPLKHSRLIVIGGFRAGGAGKTPFTLWLAKEILRQGRTVAILCHTKAFDEVLMYQKNLDASIRQGAAEVIATGNRHKTAHQLDCRAGSANKVAAPDYILCDDGFEDSRLQPHVIFRLDWETPPTDINQLIPAGKFRSLLQDHLKDQDRTTVLRCFGPSPDVIFQIDSITNAAGEFPNYKQTIAICGLGDPRRFIDDLKKSEYPPHVTVLGPDHDRDFQHKVQTLLKKHPQSDIIITEKDSFRLTQEILDNPHLFVARQVTKVTKLIRF